MGPPRAGLLVGFVDGNLMHRISARLLTLASTAALVLTAASHPDAFATGGAHANPSARGAATAPVTVPGDLDGLGFDTCSAPDQAAMDDLRTKSPYWGVGVYIGGESLTCEHQTNLTRNWVSTQARKGWHIFPLWVGLQAPTVNNVRCSDRSFEHVMSSNNSTARGQGVAAADKAIDHARSLGMAKGSTLFLDIESWDNTRSECNQPVLNFQSGWSKRLHGLGWKSGFYSSLSTGINILDYVRTNFPGTYEMPDSVWFAAHNGKQNLDGGANLKDSHWKSQRIHQYNLDLEKTFGSTTLTLDENVIAIGRGSVPGKAMHTCGVRLDFSRYLPAGRGDHTAQVEAAQCLLKQRGLFSPALSGRFDQATAQAVGHWQERAGITVTRALNASTWESLLAVGETPLVKRGSAGDRVRFLQRALTAALGETVTINGVFGPGTTSAVFRYQGAVGLPKTGIVNAATWQALQSAQR